MNVELVEPGRAAIALELDLELELLPGHGTAAYATFSPDTGTAPGTIGAAGRDLAVPDRDSGLLS